MAAQLVRGIGQRNPSSYLTYGRQCAQFELRMPGSAALTVAARELASWSTCHVERRRLITLRMALVRVRAFSPDANATAMSSASPLNKLGIHTGAPAS